MWIAMVLVGGILGLGAGAHEAMIQHRLQREGIRVRGLVVRHHMESGKDGPSYFAVVEFVDVQGSRHTFRSSSSGIRGLPVGGAVPVSYLPDAPAGARIALTGRRVWDVAFPLAIGALFTAIGIWLLATGH
ncbi:DUF3592 domain-containing protein [Streptomyces sp. NPDC059398]|uniref:DUF3592 domain-containing protein n=1 Tax=Streptomyces sp. NPDC059398 TaxID=3346820 RepID=UPI00369DD258